MNVADGDVRAAALDKLKRADVVGRALRPRRANNVVQGDGRRARVLGVAGGLQGEVRQ